MWLDPKPTQGYQIKPVRMSRKERKIQEVVDRLDNNPFRVVITKKVPIFKRVLCCLLGHCPVFHDVIVGPVASYYECDRCERKLRSTFGGFELE